MPIQGGEVFSVLLAAGWWYLMWAAGLILAFVGLMIFWFVRQGIQDRDARKRIEMFLEWERLI